jgi:hypothetical protein
MSVPLDRLYHYLDHSVDRDIIIYRWHPPGSKKLQDLQPLRVYDIADRQRSLIMVCHDQEPLDWGLFNRSDVWHQAHNEFQRYWRTQIPESAWPWGTDQVLQSWVWPDVWDNLQDQLILLHSESGSDQEQQARALGWITASIWSNGLISQDWFRYAQHDPDLTAPRSPDKLFLIYSRAWTHSREYRLWFVQHMASLGLCRDSVVRFGAQDDGHDYRDHVWVDPTWQCDLQDLGPHVVWSQAQSWHSADYVAQDYQRCMIEVVMETVIDRVHLTEKICRSLACGQPFLLLCGAGALARLRDLGFETFAPMINEDYDQEPHAAQRLRMILSEMQRLAQMPARQLQELYHDMRQRAQRNQRRFFSAGFSQQIMQEFRDSFDQAQALVRRDGQRRAAWQKHCGPYLPPEFYTSTAPSQVSGSS